MHPFNYKDEKEFEFIRKLLESAKKTERVVGRLRPGRALNIEHGRADSAAFLHDEYFSDRTTYTGQVFKCRIWISREIIGKICTNVKYDYLERHKVATKKLGFAARKTCNAAISELKDGIYADGVDEYRRIGKLRSSRQQLENEIEQHESAKLGLLAHPYPFFQKV